MKNDNLVNLNFYFFKKLPLKYYDEKCKKSWVDFHFSGYDYISVDIFIMQVVWIWDWDTSSAIRGSREHAKDKENQSQGQPHFFPG